jgi:Flp pilus assembly protein TadD
LEEKKMILKRWALGVFVFMLIGSACIHISPQNTSPDNHEIKELIKLQAQRQNKAWEIDSTQKENNKSPLEYEKKADVLYNEGELGSALYYYAKVLSIDPGQERVLLKMGIICLKSKNFGGAAEVFNQVLKHNEKQALAYEGRGEAYLAQNDLLKAEEDFKKAIKIQPNLWRSYNSLGVIYNRKDENNPAIAMYQKALELSPENIYLLNNLGYSYYLNGQYEMAVKNLRKALTLAPNYPRSHNNLGMACGMMGRYEEALKELKAGGDEAQAYNNIGYIYYLKGKYPEAVSSFQKALDLRPTFYVKAYENFNKAKEKQLQNIVNE